MPVEIIDVSGKLLQVKIRGVLTKADHERLVQVAKEAIAREGKIRALIVAEGFEGWERTGFYRQRLSSHRHRVLRRVTHE